ncbi:hypothetical protein Ahy_A08g037831 isoform B [Arachis hypogaea]|uniref:Wall-associated receptor kinase galacturonan-binding domain-containing protein n=1 Tax=Arachis hypogaea TaxID=3818 RepID=A0A445BRX4_ARAHY|nr:hypothetical protein Ahy_A08g037831 isoform B [Arachis hypogaea]
MIIIRKHTILILLVLCFLFLSLSTAQVNYRTCNQTCGSSKPYPYPFGFSSDCGIRLNCTTDGGIFIGKFPVQEVTTDSIIVGIKAQCNRPFYTFHELFSHKYAPTSGNVIFVQNCSKTASSCTVPEAMVREYFDYSEDCREGSSLSCYFENNSTNKFLNKSILDGYGCGNFMSSICSENLRNNSGATVSLEVATIQLGWWLQGACQCSSDANCTEIESPVDRKPGFRCTCKEGFVGDGFLAGTGCTRIRDI